ncbi:MAG: helix-turn-helix domain-containing protein [Patescibacteria group bacterium]
MPIFIPKKLPLEETIGEQLRRARQYKNLGLEEIAQKLNIRKEYLSAMEEENFDKLPSGLYGRKFLKKYINFLKVETKGINDQQKTGHAPASNDNPFSQKIVKKNSFIIFPQIIKNILIVGGILICFLYLIFYFQKIVTPPKLIIYQPEKNTLTKNKSILVSGQTEAESEIKINNQIVLSDQNGSFSQTVNLKKGLNTIIISAQKKYSQAQIITREILAE